MDHRDKRKHHDSGEQTDQRTAVLVAMLKDAAISTADEIDPERARHVPRHERLDELGAEEMQCAEDRQGIAKHK